MCFNKQIFTCWLLDAGHHYFTVIQQACNAWMHLLPSRSMKVSNTQVLHLDMCRAKFNPHTNVCLLVTMCGPVSVPKANDDINPATPGCSKYDRVAAKNQLSNRNRRTAQKKIQKSIVRVKRGEKKGYVDEKILLCEKESMIISTCMKYMHGFQW